MSTSSLETAHFCWDYWNMLQAAKQSKRADLDSAHAVGERCIEGEVVSLGDGLGVGLLGQHAVFAAGDGVQDADDVLVWQVHTLLDVLVRQF